MEIIITTVNTINIITINYDNNIIISMESVKMFNDSRNFRSIKKKAGMKTGEIRNFLRIHQSKVQQKFHGFRCRQKHYSELKFQTDSTIIWQVPIWFRIRA